MTFFTVSCIFIIVIIISVFILEQWSGLPRASRDISWSGLPRACRDIFWSGLPRAGRDLFWSNRMVYRVFAEIHWGVVNHHHHRQRRLAHIFVSHVCGQGPAQRDLCAGLAHFARPLPSWSYPAPWPCFTYSLTLTHE